ncbi:hypothetical protein Tco_0271917, partial [Tanacetum coccineum]
MFKDVPEAVHCSDDESVKGVEEDNAEASNLNNLEAESDSKAVSDIYVCVETSSMECKMEKGNLLGLNGP